MSHVGVRAFRGGPDQAAVAQGALTVRVRQLHVTRDARDDHRALDLIGVLTTGIESRLDRLRKGRSRVVEPQHVVVLGWSPSFFSVLSELVEASSNRKRACIVVLADRDKIEMQDEIAERVSTGSTRIVCRTGSPMVVDDLRIVSPAAQPGHGGPHRSGGR